MGVSAVLTSVSVLLLPVAVLGSACATSTADHGAPARHASPDPVPAPVPAPSAVPPDPPLPSLPDAGPDRPPAPSWHAVVDDVLDRYGAVLTELVADPGAMLRPGTDLAARWRAVVLDGALSEELVARAFERLEQDRMIVQPGPGGRAYRHVAVEVEPIGDEARPDHLSFTWCGHSPGIGIDADTGEVLDDDVAHARGTGTIRLVHGRWHLETLDQFELELLRAGSPDPCDS